MKKRILMLVIIIFIIVMLPSFANQIVDKNLKEHINTDVMEPARDKNTDVTVEDLLKIKTLKLYKLDENRRQIRVPVKELTGLEKATNLNSLVLYDYRGSLEAISKISSLKRLSIKKGILTNKDISYISNASGLNKLNIDMVTGFSSLKPLDSLKYLMGIGVIGNPDLVDMPTFENSAILDSIIIESKNIKDYSFINTMHKNVKNLDLVSSNIRDFSKFSSLLKRENIKVTITNNTAVKWFAREGDYIEITSPYIWENTQIKDLNGEVVKDFITSRTLEKLSPTKYKLNGMVGVLDKTISHGTNIKIRTRMVLWKKEEPKISIERIEGSSRFQTALKISDKLYTNANTAIIVNANKFPDALTSTVLSKKLKAPILLSGKDEIPESVNLKMKKLGVKNVVIVGGNLVISDRLERQLKANYKVRRIGGRSRYETSELVANEIGGNGAVVARGDHFADALTISSLALKNDYPIYLTKPNSLSNSTFEKIKGRKPVNIFIAGGVNAVNRNVENKLKTLSNVTRLGGTTRFDTSKKIAEHVYGNNVVNVMIARNDDFADAMVAGTLAIKYQSPILLVSKKEVPSEIKTYLLSRKATIKKGYIVGGTVAVPKAIETSIKDTMK